MDKETLAELKAQTEHNAAVRTGWLTDQPRAEAMSRERGVERMTKFVATFHQAFWSLEAIIASTLKGNAEIKSQEYMSYATEARMETWLPGRGDRWVHAFLKADLALNTDIIELAGQYTTASHPTVSLPFSRTYHLESLSSRQIEQDVGELLKELLT
ncbi:hypothetical protein [Deinococcus humi]|uniref:Uncharacterized protein n=1 Tax=Deinococcus humi TaxID=662880 RepID=A0A7W8NFA8_9DEIO|nr:hypothetical protein [Deinococcus humi]MBB5365204.1 hypothetical protein [Deinococcus humi]GGO35604.1 hypothetical protein GCM10008949_38330 [Deinococcus humi]